jgi:hypothetical protein
MSRSCIRQLGRHNIVIALLPLIIRHIRQPSGHVEVFLVLALVAHPFASQSTLGTGSFVPLHVHLAVLTDVAAGLVRAIHAAVGGAWVVHYAEAGVVDTAAGALDAVATGVVAVGFPEGEGVAAHFGASLCRCTLAAHS